MLLPDSFDDLPAGVRRAVLAHELWHVRRRDWAWLIAEEVLRARVLVQPGDVVARRASPAVARRSRRRADDPAHERAPHVSRRPCFASRKKDSLSPAAPIASRRHLVAADAADFEGGAHVIQADRRSVMIAMLAIVGTVAYSTSAFPLNAADPVQSAVRARSTQAPPRDRRPSEAAPETARERELKQQLADTNPKAISSSQASGTAARAAGCRGRRCRSRA